MNTENKKVDGNCSADEQLTAQPSFEVVDESICPIDTFMDQDSQSTVSLPSTLSARTTPPNTPTKVSKQSVSKYSSRKTSKSTKNEVRKITFQYFHSYYSWTWVTLSFDKYYRLVTM